MRIESLTDSERDTVLRFLLHRMEQETRAQLMARHPIEYIKMAPHTGEAVAGRVLEALARESS